MRKTVTCVLSAAGLAFSAAAQDAPTRLYDVPRMAGIVVDGKPDDWGGGGYIIDDIRRMGNPGASVKAGARIGWNEAGLLVLLHVEDNVWAERSEEDKLYDGDSVELYISPRKGEANVVQWIVAPGMDPRHPALRKHLYDYRTDEDLKLLPADVQAAVVRQPDGRGYTLEILFPTACIAVTPAVGRELGVQLIINDGDDPERPGAIKNVWFQGVKIWRNPQHLQRVRLAEKAGPRDIFQVTRTRLYSDARVLEMSITKQGSGYPPGDNLAIVGGGTVITNVQHGGGRREVRLKVPPFGRSYGKLVFEVGGEPLGEYAWDSDAFYLDELGRIPMTFAPAVFSGEDFPPCDFSDPTKARTHIGDYTLDVRHFDAARKPVATARAPGRYGAIVTLKAGAAERKFYVTLDRLAGASETGIRGDLESASRRAITNALARRDTAAAVLLAALHDRSAGIDRETYSNDPAIRDTRWWLRLRHALGEDLRLLSPCVFGVRTPEGYEANPDTRYGLLYYCPGRGFDCDGTWQGIQIHTGHGLFSAPGRDRCPFISVIGYKAEGYSARDILQVMDIVEVLYRVDPHQVFLAGHSGGREHARKFWEAYPERLASVCGMGHGDAFGWKDMTGGSEAGPDSSGLTVADRNFDIDRAVDMVGDPRKLGYGGAFTKPVYDWLMTLRKRLPEEASNKE